MLKLSGTATLENNLAVSYKTKHAVTIWFNNWHVLKKIKNLGSHKTWTPMFIEILFVVSSNWGKKKPRYTSKDEWFNCGTSIP